MKNRKKNLISILYEFWYSHTYLTIALILLFINLLIIAVFSAVVYSTGGSRFDSYFDALRFCIIMPLSQDGIYDFDNKESIAPLSVVIILVIVQTVLWSGSLIGFVSSIIDGIVSKNINSTGKVRCSNHFVILNWSSLGPNIIYDFSFLEENKTIVILSNHDREEVMDSIKSIFIENNAKMKNVKVFVKKGDPSNNKYLTDINISEARGVSILIDDDWKDNDSSYIDLNSFKLLMSMINLVNKSNIVVEVENEDMSNKIEQMIKSIDKCSNNVSVLSHNSVIGHILGKTCINKYYSDLYYELLSYEGVEFYKMKPANISDVLSMYNNLIPIINYDDDEVSDGIADSLYVLAKDDSKFIKRDNILHVERLLKYNPKQYHDMINICIVGNNNKLKYVQKELEDFKKVHNPNIKYKLYDYKVDLDRLVDDINSSIEIDRVIILSEDLEKGLDSDALTFQILLELNSNNKITKEDVEIYTEISNPTNYQAVRNTGVAKSILTNKNISLYVIQLLTNPSSKKFYHDIILSNTDDSNVTIDFDICKFGDLFDISDSIYFNSYSELVQTVYYSSNKNRMIIAYNNVDDNFIYLCNDMDSHQEINFTKDTIIITVVYK